jgi:hypothetical protein
MVFFQRRLTFRLMQVPIKIVLFTATITLKHIAILSHIANHTLKIDRARFQLVRCDSWTFRQTATWFTLVWNKQQMKCFPERKAWQQVSHSFLPFIHSYAAATNVATSACLKTILVVSSLLRCTPSCCKRLINAYMLVTGLTNIGNFLVRIWVSEQRKQWDLWFHASAAMLMKSVVFWVITRRRVVIIYRRFGTTYRSHLHGSR